jgi:DNA-binding NarL/FixJ family response regulator
MLRRIALGRILTQYADLVAQIRIVLADDHTIIRSGLKLLLEQQPDFKVTGEASDGREAVQLVEKLRPDVAVLDIGMPNLNGIEATRQIAAQETPTQVVILSMHSDEGYVLRALKAGARAYILKNSAEADLIRAVRAVAEGKSFFSPVISKMLLEDYVRQVREKSVEDSYDLLTPREREILQLLAEGRTNKEVASTLGLSLHTVETHRGNILQKLNLHGTPELILYAVRKGIIS